jgi:hypothetical protein
MLPRGLVFELPVPREAIAAVCESIPNLDKQINRAVALGLLEVSPDESLRVPRILEKNLTPQPPSLPGKGEKERGKGRKNEARGRMCPLLLLLKMPNREATGRIIPLSPLSL